MSDAVATTGILVKRRPATLPSTVAIATSSVANPTVITTSAPHQLVQGDTIIIAGHTGSTPAVAGSFTPTVLTTTTFTIPLNVTVGGTGGTMQRDYQAIGEIRSVTPPGFSRDKIPTSIHNEGRESNVLGMLLQRDAAFQINYVGSNLTHVAILADIIGNVKNAWQIALPSGITFSAQARVQQFMLGEAPMNAAQTADCAITWAEPIVQFVPA
jgi:hypothetical protein